MDSVIFYDTSDWQETPWLSSGGTREKRILQDLEDNLWYFKRSEQKPGRDGAPDKYYKYEFWSEIIAYQIGSLLKLDILRYDVACNQDQIGCISPSMIVPENQQLVEVGRYMTTFSPIFTPERRETRNEYTFQLLFDTLAHFNLHEHNYRFIQTLIFDALIGNSDRHQENWAFISDSFKSDEEIDIGPILSRIHHGEVKYDVDRVDREYELRKYDLSGFAPIYDSGSSLGRELEEDKVDKMLKHDDMLRGYLNRGSSELHWNNKKKVSHFKLIENIKKEVEKTLFEKSSLFLNEWDESSVEKIISTIDATLPEKFSFYKIPDNRKELIFKLVTLRYKKLISIINE